MNDLTLVRAGFKSNGFTAGSAEVNIAGMFSLEDIEDIAALLEMTIRRVKRSVIEEGTKPNE